ncbi:ABC transporter permease [Kibdelosporangium aridum]|uniref:ABC transporter permease n=1 Tax=Kibdelosporangium aridum TaxID=2030 RepID=UPI00163C6580|nr:ABC transporter permease [Kibdelosporangium aridum]
MTRLVLGAVGVGLAVMVLLVAASVKPAREARDDRVAGQMMVSEKRPGVDPLYVWHRNTKFRGVSVERMYVRAGGSNAPIPPGVDRLPGPGESLLSPALADLLSSSDSSLLQPRLSEHVVGELGVAAMNSPIDLKAVIGAPPSFQNGAEVYGFGGYSGEAPLTRILYVILMLGLVTLLTPVFIFIASSSRIAGAERDRRLAALRLVGADVKQVRRIAAAESLVSAAVGLVLGSAMFLVVRSMAADIVIANESFFPEDLVPSLPLVLLIVAAVPVVALMASQFALRRTIIEPLNVVRNTKPVRRKLLWRVLVLVAGGAMLMSVDPSDPNPWLLVFGAALLLISGPTLLPWLVERVVSRIRGSGTPALQLATRRLQLDSGTAARVVSGVAVVLAGAIALQIILAGQSARYEWPRDDPYDGFTSLEAEEAVGGAAVAAISAVPGVQTHAVVRTFVVEKGGEYGWVTVADCAMVKALLVVEQCHDGDAFVRTYPSFNDIRPGDTVGARKPWFTDTGPPTRIQIPANSRKAESRPTGYSLAKQFVLTPGAMRGMSEVPTVVSASFKADPRDPDLIEHVRNAAEPFSSGVRVEDLSLLRYSDAAKAFADMRKGLFIGSAVILVLAALSLLVMTVEQTRERRRSIAALSATGVQLSTLVRSVLWQTAIPMLIAIAAALATGVSFAAIASWVMRNPFTMDWTTIGLLTATTATLIVLVTALTLPALRSATRLTTLRTE